MNEYNELVRSASLLGFIVASGGALFHRDIPRNTGHHNSFVLYKLAINAELCTVHKDLMLHHIRYRAEEAHRVLCALKSLHYPIADGSSAHIPGRPNFNSSCQPPDNWRTLIVQDNAEYGAIWKQYPSFREFIAASEMRIRLEQ